MQVMGKKLGELITQAMNSTSVANNRCNHQVLRIE